MAPHASVRRRFLAVTSFDAGYEPGYLCSTVLEAFCARHGYEFHRVLLTKEEMAQQAEGRYGAWCKVALLAAILRDPDLELGDDDYIAWVDADAVIVDHNITFESFVSTSCAADLILGEDLADADWVNTGVMLIRCTAWCRELIARWWEEGGTRWHGMEDACWDQSALCALLQRMYGLGEERPWFSYHGGRRTKSVGSHIAVLECGSLNFKHVNNSSFVFHAVQREERLRSDDTLRLSKLERVQRAVTERHVRGGRLLPELPAGAIEGHVGANAKFNEARRVWNASLASALPSAAVTGRSWCDLKGAVHIAGHSIERCVVHGKKSVGWRTQNLDRSPIVWLGFDLPWENSAIGSFEALCASLGDLSVMVAPCAPVRALDVARGVVSQQVQVWQLCEYCLGRPPPNISLCCLVPSRRFRCNSLIPPRKARAAGVDAGDGVLLSLEVEPPGCVTRLHRADAACWLGAVVGRREYALYRPEDEAHLRAGAATFEDGQSALDPASPDQAPACPVMSAVVEAAQALFVPAGWWLWCRSLEASIVWRETIAEANAAADSRPAISRSAACSGSLVVLHYELRASDGRVLESTRDAGRPVVLPARVPGPRRFATHWLERNGDLQALRAGEVRTLEVPSAAGPMRIDFEALGRVTDERGVAEERPWER